MKKGSCRKRPAMKALRPQDKAYIRGFNDQCHNCSWDYKEQLHDEAHK